MRFLACLWLAAWLPAAYAAEPTAAPAPVSEPGAAPKVTASGKLVGVVTSIALAEDGLSAAVVLKDSKKEELVTVDVKDKLTLDKFKDKRISIGDEIRCKYDVIEERKVSTYFRKVGGC